jgi:hypothetical protein
MKSMVGRWRKATPAPMGEPIATSFVILSRDHNVLVILLRYGGLCGQNQVCALSLRSLDTRHKHRDRIGDKNDCHRFGGNGTQAHRNILAGRAVSRSPALEVMSDLG